MLFSYAIFLFSTPLPLHLRLSYNLSTLYATLPLGAPLLVHSNHRFSLVVGWNMDGWEKGPGTLCYTCNALLLGKGSFGGRHVKV